MEVASPEQGPSRSRLAVKVAYTEQIICFSNGRMVYCGRIRAEQQPPTKTCNRTMTTTLEETPVLQKTRELCQTILEQPMMQSIRQRIDTFMGDDSSRAQYEGLVNKGQALEQKQQLSMPLSQDEIADFEKHREALLKNPVARGFLDAQEELHQVQQTIHSYVNKTLELGRLPTEADLSGGGCGSGCGCGHGH